MANFFFLEWIQGMRENSGMRTGRAAPEGKRIFGPSLRLIFLLVGSSLPTDWALRPSLKQASEESLLKLFPWRELTGTLDCTISIRGSHVVMGQSRKLQSRIPGFQGKESQTLEIRDALLKATRTIPRRWSLDPLVQGHGPQPHTPYTVSHLMVMTTL